jgi:hypothetical protein
LPEVVGGHILYPPSTTEFLGILVGVAEDLKVDDFLDGKLN